MDFLDYFYYFGYFFCLVAAVFAMVASARVNSTFKKYSKIYNTSGLTGEMAARRVLDANGLYSVSIQRVSGSLTDHFDPRNHTIYLSDAVIHSATAAAVGVAAHEAGHAVQHAVGYLPIRIRSAIVPVTNIGSRLSTPLILLGILFSFYPLALIGVLCFGLSAVFQLVTLPTEFDASARAMKALSEMNTLSDMELSGARKTLRAAAMTYVAALAVAITQFLRLLAMVSRSRRND